MQTQCPHCKTTFRVTRTQVESADGYVRCGICKEVFNAIDVGSELEQQTPLLDIPLESVEAPNATELKPEDNAEYKDVNDDKSGVEKSNKSISDSAVDAFDLFDEDNNESLQHVVPENFRESYAPASQSITASLLWGIGTLILTATLIGEYVWFNRSQFNHIPELQTVFKHLCSQIECQNLSLRAPKKIELVSRNVYSHPIEKKALMVNVTMANLADFAQPYPVLQVDFSDIRGGIVAARRFYPAEYLPGDEATQLLLLPDMSTDITLEILDPGKQAMTYEFNFM